MARKFRGIDDSQIVHESNIRRDTRPLHQQFIEAIEDRTLMTGIAGLNLIFIMVVPLLAPLFLLMAFLVYYHRTHCPIDGPKKWQRLPFRMPGSYKGLDYSDPIPGRVKYFKSSGIFHIGNTFAEQGSQELWIKGGDILTHMLIFGTTGSGKAQPLDELVLTPSGYKKMGSLSAGDEVVAHDGSSTKIKGVYPQGKEDVYRITLKDGRNVRASHGHLWEFRYIDSLGEEVVDVNTTKSLKYLMDVSGYQLYLPEYSEKSFDTNEIGSIEYVGIEETQCIEIEHESSLYVTKDYIVTHNTETLVSLSYNALAMGSGFFYIDPKAAPKLAAQIYTMCRLLGRDDDFQIMSYSMQSKNKQLRHPKKIANTINPFTVGSSDLLTQLLVALIPPADGGNAVFANKAQSMIAALMRGLVDLRDGGHIQMSLLSVREYMNPVKYVELAHDPRISHVSKAAMVGFLRDCNWNEGSEKDPQKGRAYFEQFGYAISYFSLPMSQLTGTYGHIYLTEHGEIGMFDTIKNRRVLVVMLPSLEMAPETLKAVGQITLSAVRNACSVGLGDKLVGELSDVLGSLPVDSPTPFLSITDEYAAIPTPGYAEVLTQGRGLGIAAIVASQDFGGIKAGDEKGAGQIIANTKVKLCMKMEDCEDTWELFKKIASEGQVSTISHHEESGLLGGYATTNSASMNDLFRLHIRDLQEQIEGEFHAFFNGSVVRGATFYAAPPLEDHQQLRINEKVGVAIPPKAELDKHFGKTKTVIESIEKIIANGDIKESKPSEFLDEVFKISKKILEAQVQYDDLAKEDRLITLVSSLKKSIEGSERKGRKGDKGSKSGGRNSGQDKAGMKSEDAVSKLRELKRGRRGRPVGETSSAEERVSNAKNKVKDALSEQVVDMVNDAAKGVDVLSDDPESLLTDIDDFAVKRRGASAPKDVAAKTINHIQDKLESYPGKPAPIKESKPKDELDSIVSNLIDAQLQSD